MGRELEARKRGVESAVEDGDSAVMSRSARSWTWCFNGRPADPEMIGGCQPQATLAHHRATRRTPRLACRCDGQLYRITAERGEGAPSLERVGGLAKKR